MAGCRGVSFWEMRERDLSTSACRGGCENSFFLDPQGRAAGATLLGSHRTAEFKLLSSDCEIQYRKVVFGHSHH